MKKGELKNVQNQIISANTRILRKKDQKEFSILMP